MATKSTASLFFLAAAEESESASFQGGVTAPPVSSSGRPAGFGTMKAWPFLRTAGEPGVTHQR
jgi:hypothetical protein